MKRPTDFVTVKPVGGTIIINRLYRKEKYGAKKELPAIFVGRRTTKSGI